MIVSCASCTSTWISGFHVHEWRCFCLARRKAASSGGRLLQSYAFIRRHAQRPYALLVHTIISPIHLNHHRRHASVTSISSSPKSHPKNIPCPCQHFRTNANGATAHWHSPPTRFPTPSTREGHLIPSGLNPSTYESPPAANPTIPKSCTNLARRLSHTPIGSYIIHPRRQMGKYATPRNRLSNRLVTLKLHLVVIEAFFLGKAWGWLRRRYSLGR